MAIYKALTIAGSDSSGGAGLQADLKTFQERGVYGMTAITTIVAMSPENWDHQVFPVDLDTVRAQLKTIFEAVGVDALKTGMLGTPELIELVGEALEKYQADRIVIDPVLVCKGTEEVLSPETLISLREVLIPKATIAVPNLYEAGHLSQFGAIKTVDDMKEAAARIYDLGAKYVLIKGGGRLEHEKAVDLLYDGESFELLESDRIETTYTHGAGCTYAAAITAELAKGKSVKEAVYTAKAFITAAIRHSFPLNQHCGPTLHAAYRLYGDKE
ncbi:pyridoxine/pyridoxal/pyridoxamine kinase [Thermoflavimicrobium daqui]|jgi:pyridoxine kinase|uniref:pyridoxal kinase n=1 Tax=Thermoflavimicrobium daqui TaxID=2137476 RepID=A0A364K3X4_9BACL|nr:pyridoxine/pyridoxal/pyridoxamine kinase [Thermoflavimicrobium daqui]RAL23426.1 bifunctional hydroxymethylpyrimidine kinase/phosphomethylpyrimidine kinase [Thermoflavimicrobium daqui]